MPDTLTDATDGGTYDDDADGYALRLLTEVAAEWDRRPDARLDFLPCRRRHVRTPVVGGL